jgi:hypothetical protein
MGTVQTSQVVGVTTSFQRDFEVFRGSGDLSYEQLEELYRDNDIERFVNMKAQLQASMVNGYKHKNKEIEKFVLECLHGSEGSFFNVLSDAVADCIVYGHHLSEIVWQYKNGKYYIKRFVYIRPEDRMLSLNKKRDILGINLSFNSFIPMKKLLYLNYRPNYGLFGKSEIATLYPQYLLARTALYNFGRVMERNGFPLYVGKSDNTEDMLNAMKNLYNISCISITGEEDLQMLEPKSAGELFERGINLALRAYVRHLGLAELMVNVNNTGTYNLGEVQYNSFIDEQESYTKKSRDVLLAGFVKNIIDINFGGDDYGEFVISKAPNIEIQKQVAIVLQELYTADSINDELRYKMFEEAGWNREDIGTFEKKGSEQNNGNV